MKIGITLSKNAYTPEAYAYEEYLTSLNHQVQLDYELNPNNDINIYFMGVRPFWKKKNGRAKEVHEYHSLSTPPYACFKNNAKKLVSKKPVGRIFLNNLVDEDLNFKDQIPFIYRDMGVDDSLFQKTSDKPLYDVIYCGSISGRAGLIEILLKIAKNYKVIVVGQVKESERLLLKNGNITLLGPVKRKDLADIYRNARFGLNYTPDIYPYNVQTSTKTLEYLASGLGVISNRYKWANLFFNKINYDPVWLDDDFEGICEKNIVNCESIKNFSWSKILSDSRFEPFLYECLYEK